MGDIKSFGVLCQLLDRMADRKTKPDIKRTHLEHYVAGWRQTLNKSGNPIDGDNSFYPALRLILPSHDRERGSYGFKEKKLADRIIQIFGLAKAGAAAQSILHFKTPKSSGNAEVGDFALTAVSALVGRFDPNHILSLDQVNNALDQLVESVMDKERAEADAKLEYLFLGVDGPQMKWLLRILLKQMKIGMSEKTVLGIFHPDASRLYDVCVKLHDLSSNLSEATIQLFQPFRPMLSAGSQPEDVPRIMKGLPFYVEIKYDGERVLLHKDKLQYKYYSRNGNDFTSSYGASSTVAGSLSADVQSCLHPTVQSCILDGEMVGWNSQLQCIATKGEQFDVRSLKPDDPIQPCIVVFDCLMLNGNVLCRKPLHHRLKVLKESVLAQEWEGRVILAKRQEISTQQELIRMFNQSIEDREEGLVVKRMDSPYQLNVRSEKAGWLKLKPDYIDGQTDTLDLLIVGAYYGEGHRSNLLSHFLLGVADEPEVADGLPTKVRSLCKVGSGYRNAELLALNEFLSSQGHLQKRQAKQCPGWLVLGSEMPDVYIQPDKSRILEVKAAEIIVSDSYAVGFTLRFPRVVKIRDDKHWHECWHTKQFETFRVDCNNKMAHRKRLNDVSVANEHAAAQCSSVIGASATQTKRPRTGRSRAVVPTLAPHLVQTEAEKNTKMEVDVFGKKEVVILTSITQAAEKSRLRMLVRKLNGTVAENTGKKTWCIVATSDKLTSVHNEIKSTKSDLPVAKVCWLEECYKQQKCVPWQPQHLYHQSRDLVESLKQHFDEFGDSLTEPLSVDQLKTLVHNMPNCKNEANLKMDDELLELMHELQIFAGVKLYVDDCLVLGDRSTLIEHNALQIVVLDARANGAVCVDRLTQATHILMHKSDLSRLKAINALNRQGGRKHVVLSDWVIDCVNARCRLDERSYMPKMGD